MDDSEPVTEMIQACDQAAALIQARAERLTAALADDPLDRDQWWALIQAATQVARVNTLVMNMMLTAPLTSATKDH